LKSSSFVHLRQDGVSLLVSLTPELVRIIHWGEDLGDIKDFQGYLAASIEPTAHAEGDSPDQSGIWREQARGAIGSPVLRGHRQGKDFSPLFVLISHSSSEQELVVVGEDVAAGLRIETSFSFVGAGVLVTTQAVTNIGSGDYFLEDLTTYLPLPDRAQESLDFAGRWVKERQPVRRQIQPGVVAREVREGRTSHDYTILQLAMTTAATFRTGEVWSLGLMFSGNSRHTIEQLQSGRKSISAGELLMPGEMILEAGKSYEAAPVAAVYSNSGIDGTSDRSYRWLRSRADHPTNKRPRPLTLNVWEAVYFDHDLGKLTELAEVAKKIGVERFVLDDGWFGSRRDDTSGLGDWVISKDVWPEGLGPLIDVVKANGMEFGLWFEGEMVNPDSDVYRAHPEWILNVAGRVPPTGRGQLVLDLTNPECYQHIFDQTNKILTDFDISYIKWDHNRPLVDPGHNGKASVHEQTKALYRLFTDLKANHPVLEIESCASGGGRVDLGIAQIVDRFWVSDCNDALERQYIQRYTQIGIPPEMLGSHIGPTESHTTGRVHSLGFRAITALFGHAGLEWDITTATADEQEHLKNWATYYKKNRDLFHSGKVVRVETDNEATFVHGVVSQDQSKAIFAYVTLQGQAASRANAILIDGLDSNRSYSVKAVYPVGKPVFQERTGPKWLDGIVLTGKALTQIGLRPPILFPETALLIEIEAI
jgi:alpha-galactosidase|tara:strand:+ start:241 stop:2358 length:2118 start_codon:yes stop_codon:yes gene_type:complete